MVRLGQNFLADPNLLEAIVRDSGVGPDDCVLEVGLGEGVLTERLAERCRSVQVIELDRGLEPGVTELLTREHVTVIWEDAVRTDLTRLDPTPTAMVATLPYSVATPVILRTAFELPSIRSWTVMVQKEIGDRLRAEPGSKTYGAPSVLLQLTGEVRRLRRVPREVFRPRPRVDSAILRIDRTGPGPDERTRHLVKAAFAHRRKALARSVELTLPGSLESVRAALDRIGRDRGVRAEALAPGEFEDLAAAVRLPGESGPGL